MHQQFNIQQLYAQPTLYLCVLCHYMLIMQQSWRKFSRKPISCFVYVLNNHSHRVTTQLQLINIIIIIIIIIYLRTTSDFRHLQHKLIGFYNRDEKCLQRGTEWAFK
jgi:hypothetical protein